MRLLDCVQRCKPQIELEEAVREGNEKFNGMITEQLMAQEGIRRSAEAESKVCRARRRVHAHACVSPSTLHAHRF